MRGKKMSKRCPKCGGELHEKDVDDDMPVYECNDCGYTIAADCYAEMMAEHEAKIRKMRELERCARPPSRY